MRELMRDSAIPGAAPAPADEMDESLCELADFRSGCGALIADVRSPREFAEDHVPGARSVPLLSDAERAVVGTLYRRMSPEAARDWGSARVRSRLGEFTLALERALELPAVAADLRRRIVCCARGGERSEATVYLLREGGHRVRRLRGGYRAFRTAVRRRLASAAPPTPFVLNGLTGSGKTLVLRAIEHRHPGKTVDLEGIAAHRSSILGDIGLEPVPQKLFESSLAASLDALIGPWSLFEWEARRLGDREIPGVLYERLHAAPHIELRADLETRVRILCREYLAVAGTQAILERIASFERFPGVGREGVETLSRLLESGRPAEAAAFLLERHYDPRYHHGHREIPIAHVVDVRDIESAAIEVVSWIEQRQ